MKQDTAQAISSTLRLIAEQLMVDDQWAVQQLENITRTTLIQWYREQRDIATSTAMGIAYGKMIVQSPLAYEDDWSALAHATAGEELLVEAAECMEKARHLSPRPEYFRFLVSVNERMGRLDKALDTLAAWTSVAPDDPQAKIDDERIRRAIKRKMRRAGVGTKVRLAGALMRYQGGGLINAARVIPYTLAFTFARPGKKI